MENIDGVIKVLNDQKGQITALQCLLVSVVRALPLDVQTVAMREFDTEREIAKTVLLNSQAPDDVLNEFDRAVKAINDLRLDRPRN